jgi:DNA repair protein RadC
MNQVINTNVIGSWGTLLEYLKFNMGNLQIEQFRVLFLNKKNSLIADEIMATGTIDQTPVYPREIIKRILAHEAAAIILVHNHPSGSAKPSSSDIELTAQIVNACKAVNVSVHDHVIIGKSEYYSFKTNMLL